MTPLQVVSASLSSVIDIYSLLLPALTAAAGSASTRLSALNNQVSGTANRRTVSLQDTMVLMYKRVHTLRG